MSFSYPYLKDINLYVEKRISYDDAMRQEKTAQEILRRLERQPGLILADEVGMGKTFVALAVAISIASANNNKKPVVVMVPPSLIEKWPRDFEFFKEKCLPNGIGKHFKYKTAENAIDFLKLLDDPKERRKSIIFLTHGAMSKGMNDPWVKLVFIYRALYYRRSVDNLRKVICRDMGKLLRSSWVNPEVWDELLATNPTNWLDILQEYYVIDDDPIPENVLDVLLQLNTDDLFEALNKIPLRKSANFESRLQMAHSEINDEIKKLWGECIKLFKLKLPLLILDEAHHLKNPQTQLSSLFQIEDADNDAKEVSNGPLSGVFERMLFLTATPFQLGHYELCSVLDRFKGISWKKRKSLPGGLEEFEKQINELRNKLDEAQRATIRLEKMWGRLNNNDLIVEGNLILDVENWWTKASQDGDSITSSSKQVIERFNQANEKMRCAEKHLKPWVIRHVKPRIFSHQNGDFERRVRFVGRAIIDESTDPEMPGISINGNALLPFLLAARATACTPNNRPVFAEGLSSSYNAFLQTRQQKDSCNIIDFEDDLFELNEIDKLGKWYLTKLDTIIPLDDFNATAAHPKVSATIDRAIALWLSGEKVVIFCHYIATGKTLRHHLSEKMKHTIIKMGAEKLGCVEEDVIDELEKIGNKFFVEKSQVRKTCDEEIGKILDNYPNLERKEDLIDIVRRYIRTPSFLVRYFSFEDKKLTRESVIQAFNKKDGSSLNLYEILKDFFKFLEQHCGENERENYIKALKDIKTGSIRSIDVTKTDSDEEMDDESEMLIPNVRLVNGQSGKETRQNLMLTFNTPFYPEILISSSVFAEGVDLHLNCRHVIHHDLSWNPSTLEQRTGRIDRIGAKVERSGNPIHVYIPYIAETQDEKMYRVVMDRERWFKVVMGEKFNVDLRTTEKLAERVPLPKAAAEALAFRLDVHVID